MCDTQTHLFCACVVSRGSNKDVPHFGPASIQASHHIPFDRLLADPGFDAETNHRLAGEELRILLTVIAVNRRRDQNTAVKDKYRSQMIDPFRAGSIIIAGRLRVIFRLTSVFRDRLCEPVSVGRASVNVI